MAELYVRRPEGGTKVLRFEELRLRQGPGGPVAPGLPESDAELIRRAANRYFKHVDVESLAACRDESGRLRLAGDELAVVFAKGTAAAAREAILARYQLRPRGGDRYISGSLRGWQLFRVANDLARSEGIACATPSFVSEYSRASPAADWHLKKIRLAGALTTIGASAASTDVVVAVLDDGIDIEHPHLKDAIYDVPDPLDGRDTFGRDFGIPEADPAGGHFDPRPKDATDDHGTLCAGIIASDGNGGAPLGVAAACRILPVKIFNGDDLVPDPDVVAAMGYACRRAKVLSCSWTGGLGPQLENALQGAADANVPVVCAVGNNLPEGDIGFPASDPRTIAVGACTYNEVRAPYSAIGDGIDLVAPSDDEMEVGIFTTDLSGPGQGQDPGLFWDLFGGTSAATAIVAAVAALCLTVEPALTAEDVRKILRSTAKKINPAQAAYDNAGYSKSFGYGCVDAKKAVQRAATWLAS